MNNYKADITLNEKDSLQDMLNAEKNIVKVYADAITEGVSRGFRTLVKKNWEELAEDQLQVFLEMTNNGYYEVASASEMELSETKDKFYKEKGQLA